MLKITSNILIEYGVRCANMGVLKTDEGLVMIESPFFPENASRIRDEMASMGELKYLINTEPHPDHVGGNYYFKTTVVGHEGTRLQALESGIDPIKNMLINSPQGGSWDPSYYLCPPTLTFSERLTLHLGKHTLKLFNWPGHTACETAVFIPEEKVVFTGDNVVRGTMPFFFQSMPYQWLESLKNLSQLEVDYIVPGHGAVGDKSCLQEMSAEINTWLDAVRSAVDRGWDLAEAQARINLFGRYQIEQSRLEMMKNVQKSNIARIFKTIKASN